MATAKESKDPGTEISDEELMRRALSDPEVQARIREIKQQIEEGRLSGPGIGPEELPGFLRERG
jgi:anti-sigma28 factor (negative regulator of flagellin synthesis)